MAAGEVPTLLSLRQMTDVAGCTQRTIRHLFSSRRGNGADRPWKTSRRLPSVVRVFRGAATIWRRAGEPNMDPGPRIVTTAVRR